MKLTAKHLELIELVANPLDTRTYEEKAKQVKTSRQALHRLLQDPEARRLLDKRVSELISTGRSVAYQCLMDNMLAGDRASARDYLQAIGDIGTGGHTTSISVTQTNDGTGELQGAMERVANNRRFILASEE